MPEDNEWADQDAYNENMEAIDREISTNASNIAQLYEHDTTLPMTAVSAGSTEEEINSFYDNYSADMENCTHYKAITSHGIGHSIFGGGMYYLEGCKILSGYEWQELTSYKDINLTIMRKFVRSKENGTWTPWKAVDIGNIQTQLNEKADSNHTHSYAGSASAGGSAASAVKLDTSAAGSLVKPCYFTNGKPEACTYELNKTVPFNAVFTDTDTKVINTLATTTKAYLTGTTAAATNTGTQVFDTGVYLTTEAGELNATKFKQNNVSGQLVSITSAAPGNTAMLWAY